MTPAVQPPDPTLSKRALDVIQWLATVAGSLGIVTAFMVKVGKPYFEWRKRRMAEIIREVLKEELLRMDGIATNEEEIINEQRESNARLANVFMDLDVLLDVAIDNRERLDEINGLMDELGLSSRDRREIEPRVAGMIEGLVERRRIRRRRLPIIPREL